MRNQYCWTLVAILFFSVAYAQEPSNLLRFPALNRDGSFIAFSYQGDIWTVPAEGGRAMRLTVHPAYESHPIFSPDGRQIAFSGERYGNEDLFLIPVEGGMVRRLTHHSAADTICSWTPDGDILFTTSRQFRRIERPPEIYSISSRGGTESRRMDTVGFDPALSPDGKFLAFVRGDANPVFREEYRGPSQRDIWLYHTGTKTYSRLIDFETNDIFPQWGDAGTLYFLSSRSGRYNLYKAKIDGSGRIQGKAVPLTDFRDHSIRAFSVSADGKTIVLEREMGLFLLKTGSSGPPRRVEVRIAADDRLDPTEQKSFSGNAEEYQLSPNGKAISLTIRGEIFIKEVDKEKSRSVNLSESPYRDRNAIWVDDKALLFVSDREEDNYELYLAKSSDPSQPDPIRSLKHEIVRLTKTAEDEAFPVMSHDGKKVAYLRGRGSLVVADISPEGKITGEKILLEGWAAPQGVVWSPDNRWLAYSLSDLYANDEVYIQSIEGDGKPVNVSMHPRTDSSPFWSSDGSKLGFLSERNNRNRDVWFVWLKQSDWEKTQSDWEEKEPVPTDKKADAKESQAKETAAEVKPIRIDTDRIHERLLQVTNFPGDEGPAVFSRDGETIYYIGISSSARGRDLYSIKWNGKELKEVTKGGTNPFALRLDREGKYLYFQKTGGLLQRQEVKADRPENLPYTTKMKIDYPTERRQIFDEAWRAIRDRFYDPQFHGKDWNALRVKYRPLCLAASTNSDFRDMFNNMLGELNSSHVGMNVQERGETQKDVTGLLGVELSPVAEGMKVVRVVPDSPAAKESGRLYAEDVLLAVDGIDVKADENFFSLLNAKVDEKVLLRVKGKDGKEREVVLRPIASDRQLLYKEWVRERSKLVDTFSGGRLGYIHIQGMDMGSFEVFERELTAAGYGKEGLVIDVRYNGGGSTTDYLMTVLNYKQHAYTIPRGASGNLEQDKRKFRSYYPIGERIVYAPWIKPSIALCNEGSYSNAEIFSHAYQSLGIGKLVGRPTNGSVISTGALPLIDGSMVRLPSRAWFVKATDKNQELGPAVPDILVENEPDWIAKGTDEQLRTAVVELLKQIDSRK